MSSRIRAVIVDDEVHCVETLVWQIEQYCPEIELLASFKESTLCQEYIQENDIDLLLVDVEMPMLNGIDLVSSLKEREFKVIFTTAYGDIDVMADKRVIGVLLKPIDHTELKTMIESLIPG